MSPGFNERCDEHRDRHQNYHREDINGGWVETPRAKIPNEVRNRDDCTTNNAHNAHTAHKARDTVSLRTRLSRPKCRALDFRLEHREFALNECEDLFLEV